MHPHFIDAARPWWYSVVMGSILIRKVPDPIHQSFKKLCQRKKVSMEKEIVRLMQREVVKASRRR